MMDYSFIHNTPMSIIEINTAFKIADVKELRQYEDKSHFNNLCEKGCVNYNMKWSCPPYSPSYSIYSKDFKYCLVILLFCQLSQLKYVKSEYMKVKTSNSILKSQADKLSRFLEAKLNGKMLSNGSCRLCKPCSKKASANSCRKPLMLRFSLEALGLNVERISHDLFNHQLLWYKDKTSPEYSSVISAVLFNSTLLQTELANYIENYGLMNNIHFIKK